MATLKKNTTYNSQGKVEKISAVSRIAVKVRDNYFTIEASEERSIMDPDKANMNKEWQLLFDEINGVTDTQIQEVLDYYKNKK